MSIAEAAYIKSLSKTIPPIQLEDYSRWWFWQGFTAGQDSVPVADGDVWAELITLREAVKGPTGYSSWQDAATAERLRRVVAERELQELRDAISKLNTTSQQQTEQ